MILEDERENRDNQMIWINFCQTPDSERMIEKKISQLLLQIFLYFIVDAAQKQNQIFFLFIFI